MSDKKIDLTDLSEFDPIKNQSIKSSPPPTSYMCPKYFKDVGGPCPGIGFSPLHRCEYCNYFPNNYNYNTWIVRNLNLDSNSKK